MILNIQRQPGANIIDVVDRIKALLPQLQASLPAGGARSPILTDRTTTIRASVERRAVRADAHDRARRDGDLPVPAQRLAATVIPSVAVPLSLVGTFGVMYLLGYSLNNLTLMALTISTGFVVDDAIVMIENISRYIEEGEPPLEAALKGSEQIGFTIVSLTRVADRRADSAAVHGRHRRPAVPRVRGHAQRDDPGLGGRLADADADDVREAAAAHARVGSRARLYRASERAFEPVIDVYGRDAALGAAPSDVDAARRRRHAGRDDLAVHRRSPRASSRCRTRA